MSSSDRYRGLTEHLRGRSEPVVELSIAEIDRLVNGLPASATKHAAWWTNSRTSQPHSWAWLDADRSAQPDLNAGHVRFVAGAGAAGTRPQAQRDVPATTPSAAPAPASSDVAGQWFWEGNIQAAVVSLLASDGWAIMRVADTSSREHGVDIDAVKDDDRLVIEVKGYPSNESATQARTYFGNALLSGMLMRSQHTDARVVLAFPAVTTFQGLAQRTAGPLRSAGVEVWLVSESGDVQRIDPEPDSGDT